MNQIDYNKPELLYFEDDGDIPNNPTLPVVLIRRALAGHSAASICRQFEDMGWTGTWTYVVFTYHHFHPDAHEALCVASGWADIVLGGPSHVPVRVEAGDLIVLPAGTGHCRVNSSNDFAICGAYPPGQQDYTTLGVQSDAHTAYGAEIAAVPLPKSDPVFGLDGPLMKAWSTAT